MVDRIPLSSSNNDDISSKEDQSDKISNVAS